MFTLQRVHPLVFLTTLLFLITLAPLSGPVPALAAIRGLEVTHDASAVTWVREAEGVRPVLPGTARAGQPGRADLPVTSLPIAPPEGMRLAAVRVAAADWVPLEAPGSIPLYEPAKAAPGGTLGGALPLVAKGEGGYLRGQRLEGVAVSPIQPDGSGGWRLARRLQLDLEFEPDTGEPLIPARGPRGFEFMAAPANLRDFRGAASPEAPRRERVREPLAAPSEPFSPRFRPSLDGSAVSYLIITSEALAPEFQVLADWRTRTGYPAVLRTVEWIEENYPDGSDVQERMRAFIREAVELWGTEWVLLGGDDPILPVRYGRTTFFGGERIPTDMYFQCLDGTWNENGNDLYGEGRRDEARPGDSSDLFPDVWIGRLPAATPVQARTMIEKVLRYEQSPPVTATYPAGALILAEVISPATWDPSREPIWDGAELAEDVVDIVSPHLALKRLYENHTAWEGAEPETLSKVIEEWNRGYGFIHHVGHGFYDNMSVGLGGDGQVFKIPDADALVNGNAQSVLYAINCTSAAVDFDCIVEHLLYNRQGGIVGAVGSTRFDFPGTSEVYDLEYYELVFNDSLTRIGEAATLAKVPFVPLSTTDNAHRWTQFTLIALADPAMRLYTATPGVLEVAHPASMPLGAAEIEFTVTSGGAPLPGARVTCYREGELLAFGETDGDGKIAIALAPRSTGEIGVVVTAPNHVARITGGIEVADPEGGYPVLATTTVSDGPGGFGNGNDRLEAGERGTATFVLRNAGSAALTGVSVMPVPASLDVTLVGTSGTTPAIDPGGEAGYAFEVRVGREAADLTVIPVTLTVLANEGAWDLQAPLYIGAPVVDLHALEVTETVGNGDGNPDPGETVRLVPRFFNRGAGASFPLLASLELLGGGTATFLDDEIELGSLEPGSMSGAATGFEIELGEGSELPRFRLRVVDLQEDAEGEPVSTERFSRRIDLVPPAPPAAVIAEGRPRSIAVSWDSSGAPDVLRYVVEVAEAEEGPYTRISPFNAYPTSRFVHAPLQTLARRYYRVAAQDSSGNLSAFAGPAAGIPEVFLADGFPIESAVGTITSPLAVDLDGDGALELVTGGDQIYVVRADGSELRDGDGNPGTRGVWSDVPEASGFWAPPSVGDLDGDGRKEVVAVTFKEGTIYAWDDAGNVLPGFPRPTAPGGQVNVFAAPVLADLNGDGRLEIAVQAARAIYAYDHLGKELRDGDGNPSTTGVFFTTNSAFSYGTPAAVDLDGDARDELVVPTRAGFLHLLDDDGRAYPGGPMRFGGFITSSPAVADLDGDGGYEIVFGTGADSLEVRRADGSIFPGWPKSVNMQADLQSSPAVGDVDGDGDLEIAVVAANTTVYLWHHDGTAFPGFPIKLLDTEGNAMLARGSIAFGNMDEDDDLELAFANQDGVVAALDLDATMLDGFPVQVGAAVEGGVLLADLDGDGFNELALSSLDRQTYLYRTAGRAVASDWTMFHHDPRRTGRVGAPLDDADLPRLRLRFPGDLQAALGSMVPVAVQLDNNVAVGRMEFTLTFDDGVLEVVSVQAGERTPGFTVATDQGTPGRLGVVLEDDGGPGLGAGSGEVAVVLFSVVAGGGGSSLDLTGLAASNPEGEALPIGAESGSLTSVRGVSVTAEGTVDGTLLRWSATADAGHLGFRVLRATAGRPEPSEALHDGLLPPRAREYLDATAAPGSRYLYTLEAHDRSGAIQRFGPVEVVLPVAGLRAGIPFPNPMRGAVRLEVRGDGAAEVAVIDAAGRRIRTLLLPDGGSGLLEWDGRLESGAEAPAGIYFLHLRGGNASVTRRVVKLGS